MIKMDSFTPKQREEAGIFSTFYFDLLENQRENFTYHLSDEAVLDWFGKTMKGTKNINEFAKFQMGKLKHNFTTVEPCHSIAFKSSHIIKYSSNFRGVEAKDILDLKPDISQEKTPPNVTNPSSSRKREKGQGDGLHNCTTESPAKRTRLAGDVIIPEIATPLQITNITTEGHVEFHAKSSKKYQKETKWSRPCRLHVAYSKTPAGYLIHLIIYQGNMRCRRNLLKEFDAVSELV